MHPIELKQKWQAGEPSPGMWIRLSDPTVCDMIGDLGFDWVIIDAEHSALDLQTLQALFIALEGLSPLPLVRVPGNDQVYIKRVLDAGAAGVLVPQVKTLEDAKQAVAACKYPPKGVRGAGPRRPSRYGRLREGYFATANEQTIVLIMLETVDAVSSIDAILSVEGLDGIIVGPRDLAMSMGFNGNCALAEVKEVIRTVARKARTAQISFGSGGAMMDNLREWLTLGAQIVRVASDELLIQCGANAAMERFHMGTAQHDRKE
ncbi:MAG: HpcH/HpaI aldolase family protein [bacterium]